MPSDWKIILASKSPRRHQLMKMMGLAFEIKTKEIAEDYPDHLPPREVPDYLAQLKSDAFLLEMQAHELYITSDTVVILDEEIIEKPLDLEDARRMLGQLSGRTHEVCSGVCIRSREEKYTFTELTKVTMRPLDTKEIDHYLKIAPPLDRAGAYGIQDWIGLVGVEAVSGCFYNVVGLPTSRLYRALKQHFPQVLSI